MSDKKDSQSVTRERIVQHLLKGDVQLNADEERLLARWIFTDDLIRSRKYDRQEMVSLVSKRFLVSKYTVERDIVSVHQVFGATRQMSKKYLLSHHIDEIGLLIQKAKNDAVLKPMLPKLIDAYTKAVEALPDYMEEQETAPTKLQFILNGGDLATGLTASQALVLAKKYLKRKSDENLTDYEYVKCE